MDDPTSRTAEEVRTMIETILANRLNEGFLQKVSEPGNLVWLGNLIETAFDRIEKKPRPASGVRA